MSSSSYKPNTRVIVLQPDAVNNSRPPSLYSTGSSASRSSQYTTYSSQSTMNASRSSSSSSRGSGASETVYRSGRADPSSGYTTRVQEISQRNGPGIVLIQHNHSGSSGARREEHYSRQSTHGSGNRGSSYYK